MTACLVSLYIYIESLTCVTRGILMRKIEIEIASQEKIWIYLSKEVKIESVGVLAKFAQMVCFWKISGYSSMMAVVTVCTMANWLSTLNPVMLVFIR